MGEWGGEHPKATKKFNEYNKASTLTSPKNSLQNVVKIWNFLLPSLKKFDLSVDRGAALYPIRGGGGFSLERLFLNSWYFLGRVCGGVSFLLIIMQAASGLSVFSLHCRYFLFLRRL